MAHKDMVLDVYLRENRNELESLAEKISLQAQQHCNVLLVVFGIFCEFTLP